jgi:hypothetical protein
LKSFPAKRPKASKQEEDLNEFRQMLIKFNALLVRLYALKIDDLSQAPLEIVTVHSNPSSSYRPQIIEDKAWAS